ncbi:peroxiredoxin [Lysobacter sp. SG-8]|uniref:Glutathione-dependent peroxiredoxin n=1 Tax=Marilutibacter penaei TaxID=2759900 RepID=A0A7W3YDY8_9GAMM|nr:peroxiredoxin [Lysobacter penaei]MBB1087572.1 peroxiredoxin [Lysobacter penaei]
MSIQTGDTLPDVVVQQVGESTEPVNTRELLGTGKAVLFAVPGAFTPTCSEQHLPGFIEKFDAFKAQGVDVACLSVNDPFVMQAWAKSQQVPDGLKMLADGNADFTRALGLELDASGYGMGVRAKRFALYAEDGVVKQLFVEAPGEFRVSSAEHVLSQLS